MDELRLLGQPALPTSTVVSTHLVWVATFPADDSKHGSMACRALRLESEAVEQLSHIARFAVETFDRSSREVKRDHRRRDTDQLWADYGCSGQRRREGNVEDSLRTISEASDMEWVYPSLWGGASVAVHGYNSAGDLFEGPADESRLVWASPNQRVSWLAFLIETFRRLTLTTSTILNGGEGTSVQPFQGLSDDLLQALNDERTPGD